MMHFMSIEDDVKVGASNWDSLIESLHGAVKKLASPDRNTILFGADSDGLVTYLFLKKSVQSLGQKR